MNWNWRAMRAVIRKDLHQVTQNRMIWLPMILVPALLQVVMPLGLMLMPRFLSPADLDIEDMAPLLNMLPPLANEAVQNLSVAQQWIVLSSTYMFAPLFLVVPLMVSAILGADSFVGEKERATLEGLLYTPISDTELFVAKVLTALIPAQIISTGSFILYAIVVNAGGYAVMGRVFFPTATWWPLVFWLGPGCATLSLGATVLVSSKATTFMQAQQISGLLVLPVVFLMIGQLSGLLFLGIGLILILGLFVWLAGLWLIWIGSRTYARGELITRI